MPGRGQHGQSVLEYILLVFLAGLVALAVWATLSGGPVKLASFLQQKILAWLK